MSGLTQYPVFDWILKEERAAVEARAELSGGTLVEVYRAADVERRDQELRISLGHIIRCARSRKYSQLKLDATRLLAKLGGKA